ncbi:MAG: hypothetical protein ACE5I4_00890 [Thermoplasmata archaeon]
MANLLAHALFALALVSVPTSILLGTPLTASGFYAGLVAILPDAELRRGRDSRTPYGHSLAYGLLWALLALPPLTLAAWAGLLPIGSFWVLLGACVTGLASHLFLDALTEPGVLTWRRADGTWGRVAVVGGRWTSRLNLLVSGLSVGTVLVLLSAY